MKVGDLVKHKRFGTLYIVAETDKTNMVGVYQGSTIKFIHRSWVEVINEGA